MRYLRLTGRDEAHVDLVESYLKAQGMFGIPRLGEVEYSDVLEINLADIEPSIAGPKRPQIGSPCRMSKRPLLTCLRVP